MRVLAALGALVAAGAATYFVVIKPNQQSTAQKAEAEAKARRDAAEAANAEAQAKRDAEAQAKRDAEAQAKRESEEKAQREAKVQAQRDAESNAKLAAETSLWNSVKSSRKAADVQKYLNRYPNGHYAEPARQRMR